LSNRQPKWGHAGLLELLEVILGLPPTQRAIIVQTILQATDIRPFWPDLTAELETAYIASNPILSERLREARQNKTAIPFEVVRERLGI